MNSEQTLGSSLVKGLVDLWEKEELSDFTVVVDDKQFKCHRLVLGACSEFFRAMLRTGMREREEGVAYVKGIDKETFGTLLKSVYTGVSGLTKENAIDMWHATHQLQMTYMIQECENFITANSFLKVENCVSTLCHAKQLGSSEVVEKIGSFMAHNFKTFKETNSYLDLPCDDIWWIVRNDKLDVYSLGSENLEDLVTEFIIAWVRHIPQSAESSHVSHEQDQITESKEKVEHTMGKNDTNQDHAIETSEAQLSAKDGAGASCLGSDVTSSGMESHNVSSFGQQKLMEKQGVSTVETQTGQYPRAVNLKQLLGEVRLCLASIDCLQQLLKQELVQSHTEVFNMVLDALLYKLDPARRHGPWPDAAIPRNSSGLVYAMIYIENNQVKAYDLRRGSFHVFSVDPQIAQDRRMVQLAVFNNIPVVVYSPNGSSCNLEIYKGEQSAWDNETCNENWNSNQPLFLAHDCYILMQNNRYGDIDGMIIKFGQRSRWLRLFNNFPRFVSAVTFGSHLILFSNSTNTTIPSCVDTTKRTRWQLEEIGGPTENLISFTHHQDTYMLQKNGALWKLVHVESEKQVEFQHVYQLWDFQWEIYGGVFYKGRLFIFGDSSNQADGKVRKTSVPGIFESIEYVLITSWTRCLPMVVQQNQLKALQ